MKKLLTVIFLACAMVFAQEGSIKPEFQAFSGALIKLKKAEKGFHKFRLRVDVAPWSFLAEGEVQAPGGDSDVLITALFDRALLLLGPSLPKAKFRLLVEIPMSLSRLFSIERFTLCSLTFRTRLLPVPMAKNTTWASST